MLLSFQLVAERLAEQYPGTTVEISCGKKFRYAKAYQGELEQKVLYVLLGDPPAPAEALELVPCVCHRRQGSHFRHAICVPDEVEMTAVFNEVLSIFDRFAAWELAVMEDVARKKSLNDILSHASMVTPNPIQLIDPSMRMVAHSSTDILHEISVVYRHILRTGYPPYHVLMRQVATGEQERLNKTRGVFHVQPDGSVSASYECRNIFEKDQLVAHIFHINIYTGPTASGLEIADRLGEILTPYLKDAAVMRSQAALGNALFHDLLEGKELDEAVLRGALCVYQWKPEDPYRIAHLHSVGSEAVQYFLAQLTDLPGILEEIQVIFYGKCYILLFHNTKLQDILEIVTPLAERFQVYVTIGKEFHGIQQLAAYQKQLLTTTAAGLTRKPNRYVLSDEDMGIYDLISSSAGIPLKQICHEGVYRLYEYDRKNNTNFIKVLLTYMECGCNGQKAAAALFIHRNTLNGYLSRISSILQAQKVENGRYGYILLSLYLADARQRGQSGFAMDYA